MSDREGDPDRRRLTVLPPEHEAEYAATVEPETVLERLAALDVRHWTYASDASDAARHVGPAADDFQDAFGLNADTVAAGDPDGVAFAAIQGLTARIEDQREHIDRQRTRIETQQATIDEQRDDLESLRSTVESIASDVAALRDEPPDDR